jgi:hypothetical protein
MLDSVVNLRYTPIVYSSIIVVPLFEAGRPLRPYECRDVHLEPLLRNTNHSQRPEHCAEVASRVPGHQPLSPCRLADA